MTQSDIHNLGYKCQWPVHYNDQNRDFDLCGQMALFMVKMPALVYLCEEHYQKYLKMIGKEQDYG